MNKREFSNGEVIVLKMISGEEVIMKVESESVFPETLIVRHPHVISTNGEAFALMPYIITADEDRPTEINTNNISAIAPPLKAISDVYIEKTSGIQLITP